MLRDQSSVVVLFHGGPLYRHFVTIERRKRRNRQFLAAFLLLLFCCFSLFIHFCSIYTCSSFSLSIQTWTQPVSYKPILKSNSNMMVTILICCLAVIFCFLVLISNFVIATKPHTLNHIVSFFFSLFILVCYWLCHHVAFFCELFSHR